MTLKTQSNTRGMTIDDAHHRLVFDRVDNEVRVFEHYYNDFGIEKLRCLKQLKFDSMLQLFHALYVKGEMR